MTVDLLALGRRAVRCPGWRWLGGMRVHCPPDNDERGDQHDCRLGNDGWHPVEELGGRHWVPDLSDPCTVGGLLVLVREAWGDPLVHLHFVPGGYDPQTGYRKAAWHVTCGGDGRFVCAGPTEAEALVVALERAPG